MNVRWNDMALAGGWLVLDQATKAWASRTLFVEPVTIVPGFLRLALSHNRGALFGWMGDMPDPWRSIALTGLPLLAIVAIVALLIRSEQREIYARVGLALILGGAVGNVIDRLAWGHVVDFIDVYTSWEPLSTRLVAWFGTNRWPTFNIADTGLTCGATLLLFEVFIRRQHAQEKDAGAPVPD